MATKGMLRTCIGRERRKLVLRLDLTNASIYNGTVSDNSLLIDHLGSYVFNSPDAPMIDQHIVMGISLGGHATWQMLFNEHRVTAAVVIIGCPDYMSE